MPAALIGTSVNEEHIIPIEQNFEWLTSAVTYAAYHVTHGLWNKGVMDDYLHTCAILKRVQSHLWSVLKADREEVIDVTDNKIDIGYAPITTQDQNFIPMIWQSCLDIISFIDCGMHLIFHEVLVSIVKVFNSVFTDVKMGTVFENTVNVYLLEIKLFRLEWCKTNLVPKNSG